MLILGSVETVCIFWGRVLGLYHTGASMEIERDRPLKDLSEDLGHSSSATTDTVYVQVERKRRASSGKDRKVE